MGLLIIGLCGQSVFLRVPHFHAAGETLHAFDLFTEPGGKGYNQAVAARRAGADVVFAGAVGEDADADLCEARLKKEGIGSRLIRKSGRTAYACILTDDGGENRVTVSPGVTLTAGDVRGLEGEFRSAGLLLLTPEIPEEAFAEAVRLAKRHRVPIVLNPAPFFPWVRRYLGDAWLLTPNRSEACAMLSAMETGAGPADDIEARIDAAPNRSEACAMLSAAETEAGPADDIEARIEAAGLSRLVVTLGAAGVLCREDGKTTRIPAPRVKAVDTTGAGDCLNGVLCALLLEGMPLSEAVKAAVRAASLSVEHAHVLDGMPYRDEVL